MQRGVAERSCEQESQKDDYDDHDDSKTGNAIKTTYLGSFLRLVFATVLKGFAF